MNENNEEEGKNGFDPTKDAFFSDLVEMEEDIATEGYQLVEHAISLFNSKYYDDSIELLRQAIGLYAQINREAEINAINQKISDIYMLKEREFRDIEIALDQIEPVSGKAITSSIKIEEDAEERLENTQNMKTELGEKLITEAQKLIEIDEFDEALEKYDESFIIYEKLNDTSKLQEISDFIEDCYQKKASFLKIKTAEKPAAGEENAISRQESTLDQKITGLPENDIEKQMRVKHLSGLAYKLLAQATEQAENLHYDEAINLFDEANILFKQLNWDHEEKEVQQKIEQLKQDKENQIVQREELLTEENLEVEETDEKFEQLDKEARERFQELKGKAEKIFEIERQKEEDEIFQNEISEMVDNAEKQVRDYEYALRKDLNKTLEEIFCPYSEVIDIYTDIKNRLLERGWTNQAQPYYLQINIYKEKLKKHEKLRATEAQKIQKQKEIEEMKKMESIEEQLTLFEKKMERLDDLRKIETQKEDFENKINTMVNQADKMEREYTIALKKKNFIDCPYPEIIEIYRSIQKMLQDQGLDQEASYYNSSIHHYKEKLVKDKKLREIEAKKAKKDEEYQQTFLKKNISQQPMIKKVDQSKKEAQQRLSNAMSLIDEVEKKVKKYEISMRRNILENESPYLEAIAKYREARKILQEIGWEEEANKLISTIQFYKEKKDKDDKLRALEEKRIRQFDLEKQQALIIREEKKKKEEYEKKELYLKKERYEKDLIEKKREHAYILMDHAKKEVILKNFDKAIQLYEESKQVFKEINWEKGISMIDDSIKAINKKIEEYELKKQEIKEKQLKEARLKLELDEKISKIQGKNQLAEAQKREELLMKQKIKDQEKDLSQEAYNLLEIGTSLIEAKKFDETIEKYVEAREIFAKIGWTMEVSRINNELLLNIKREKREYERLLELRKKTEEAKEERGDLIRNAQQISKESIKSSVINKVNKEVIKNLETANIFIDNMKYNEAILKLKETIKILEKLNQLDEINKIKHQIINLKNQSLVPIIIIDDIDKFKEEKAFILALNALDNANISLSNNRYMKAISELNEAYYNLKALKFDDTILNEIEIKIIVCKDKISGKTRLIAGSEEKTIDQDLVSKIDEELKARIETRRIQRAKRVQDLLKNK